MSLGGEVYLSFVSLGHLHACICIRGTSYGCCQYYSCCSFAGIDLSEQNFDSPLGRRSLRRMYDHVVQDSVKLPVGVTLADIRKDAVLGPAVRGPIRLDPDVVPWLWMCAPLPFADVTRIDNQAIMT